MPLSSFQLPSSLSEPEACARALTAVAIVARTVDLSPSIFGLADPTPAQLQAGDQLELRLQASWALSPVAPVAFSRYA